MDTHTQFNQRLKTLGNKHAKMTNGYTSHVRGDGLIVVKPKRATRRGFPMLGLLALVAGFFVFKAIMFASLGDITYNERVAKLGNSTMVEQAGAWVMQADPVTQFIAGFADPFFK